MKKTFVALSFLVIFTCCSGCDDDRAAPRIPITNEANLNSLIKEASVGGTCPYFNAPCCWPCHNEDGELGQ